MTMETKRSIFEAHLAEWLAAAGDRKKRREMTDAISRIAKVHPKSVPRSFRRVQMRDPGIPEQRGRKTIYGAEVTAALHEVSEAAHHPCGENLHALIHEYVRIFRRDGMWRYGEETTRQLLAMSVATVKRRAEAFSHVRTMVRGKSTTRPGSIKALIPLRSGPWDEAPTGTAQIDTVAHCGDSIAGDFAYTVNAADVATLWSERRAQWNKGQEQTIRSMDAMDAGFPFPVVEWHPDTGSEFINWLCWEWAKDRGQTLTRSRPNHKNDNCFVEERNGHVVRKWVGYARCDEPEVVSVLNELYDVLTPYLNHFIASRRIVAKERIGAKWKITREKRSRTPYERVMGRSDVAEEVKQRLRAEHEVLNPLIMRRAIDRRLRRVFDVRKRTAEPK
ncbi:MAG: hypothetical protein B7X03_03945 [Parcubacteria group bacterium 21-58-10]|nr:MAG: hypothetical protein B7X03_03945 [Parcubacteria group bacterium 21-58-10]